MPPIARRVVASPFADYTPATAQFKPRIIARVVGEVGSGKTDFCLDAPGPIVVHTFDQGTEGVVEEYVKRGKEIYLAQYDLGVDIGAEITHEMVLKMRDQFVTNFERDVRRAKTIIIDRESDLWGYHVFAETGTDDKFAAAKPKEWPKIKGKMRRLTAMAKASNVNLFYIQGMRNKWVKSVNKNTGNETSVPNGERIPDGMDEIEADVHINLFMERIDQTDGPSKFIMRVGKSRGPGSSAVQGQTFEISKPNDETGDPGWGFKDFAQLVYPDSTDADWS